MTATLTAGYQLTEMYRSRVRQQQDMAVIVSDYHNRRGTGKTVLSLKLAAAMDRTEEGLTEEKVSLSPADLAEAYVDLPKGSALVLDEAEAGLSKYRAGSAANMAMRQLVSMGRVRQKYLIMNLPASSELDRDLKALCDYWLLVRHRGEAQGHQLRWNPYSDRPLTPKAEVVQWSDLQDPQLQQVYDYLTAEKLKHLRGESSEAQHLTKSQHQKLLKQATQESQQQQRDEMLREIYRTADLTQQQLADAVGLSRSRIGDIVADR